MTGRHPVGEGWLNWQHQLSLAIVVVLLVATMGMVMQTYANLDRADEIHQRSTLALTNMTNVQREAGLLTQLLLEDQADDAQIEIRHQLLNNQARLLAKAVSSLDAELAAPMEEFLRRNEAVDEIRHRPDGETVSPVELQEAIGELQLSAKRLFDRTEQAFFAAFQDANRSRGQARVALQGLAAATFLVGLATTLSLRRRVRGAFFRAYTALETEVSQRQASEAAVATQADQLARYAEQLEAVNCELVEADDVKNRFLSVVSHELRTPLTAILGLGETMAERWGELTEQQRRDFTRRIVGQAKRQIRLVEDLLNVSRILNDQIRPTPLVLTAGGMLASIIGELDPSGTSDHPAPRLNGDLQASVYVDPDHLAQIVTNLVGNAFKYGAPPVVINVAGDHRTTTVDVTDHGGGVPPEFVPDMFKGFSQSSIGDRRTASGLGLGLSIVQELTSANGGVITYAAGPGTSTFTIRLPASRGRDEQLGELSGVEASFLAEPAA